VERRAAAGHGPRLLILDTHAWVWWVGETGDLSPAASEAIAAADRIGVCAISCWEVAMLVARGRLELDSEVEAWVAAALAMPRVDEVRLDARTATRAGCLGRDGFPGDPADRIIYTTARELGVRLVSRDQEITGFDPARVVW
jgi:PIN domain nuclease of toxin-antitoxin system